MKNLLVVIFTTLLLGSCGKAKILPTIMVESDFVLVDQPEMDRGVRDTIYHFMSIRDAKTDKIEGYICIKRDTLSDRLGKEGAQ